MDETECARTGENCMAVYEARMNSRSMGRTSTLWKETQSFESMLGEELTVAVEFNFTNVQLLTVLDVQRKIVNRAHDCFPPLDAGYKNGLD